MVSQSRVLRQLWTWPWCPGRCSPRSVPDLTRCICLCDSLRAWLTLVREQVALLIRLKCTATMLRLWAARLVTSRRRLCWSDLWTRTLLGDRSLALSSLFSLALWLPFIPALRDMEWGIPSSILCIRLVATLSLWLTLLMAGAWLPLRDSPCRIPPTPPSPLATRIGR